LENIPKSDENLRRKNLTWKTFHGLFYPKVFRQPNGGEGMKIKRYTRITSVGAALALCLATQVQASGSGSGMVDNDMLQELKRMIEQQQAQIDKQAAEIAALKEQLGGTSEALASKADIESVKSTDKMVTSNYSNVNLSLYGHLNRALMYVNNVDTSKWYSVDNNNAQSRFGLRTSVDTATKWKVGGRIEYGMVFNASNLVNNENSSSSQGIFNLRWAEISFRNDHYGMISLGKGDAASNGIAQVDLSGTVVASYSGIDDMAGATFWYDGVNNIQSDLHIRQIYDDFDGLNRTDRIRYDTPSFSGFSFGTSASSGDAFDGAIRYNRKFGETKVAAALGAANPGELISNADVVIAGSISVLLPMGFNATFSSGSLDLKDSERDNPTNWWTKLGYQTIFYDSAVTSLSIDYGETADLLSNGEKGKTWAFAAVHNVINWATEFYLAYRGHSLDSDTYDFDDIHAFWTGARLKF
jgi:hypothetical protein